MKGLILAACCGLAAWLAPATSHAQAFYYQQNAAPVHYCTNSLSSAENGIRKRPLAIVNEGTVTKTISCSMPYNTANEYTATGVYARFYNNGTAAATVNCTLVDGVSHLSAITYYPKTLSLNAGASSQIVWTAAADNGGTDFLAPNLSCSLPPAVEIYWIVTETSRT